MMATSSFPRKKRRRNSTAVSDEKGFLLRSGCFPIRTNPETNATEVLLISKKRKSPPVWNVTAGPIDPGEIAVEAAARGTKERAGVVGKLRDPERPLGVWLSADRKFKTSIFVLDVVQELEKWDDDETIRKWFTLDEAEAAVQWNPLTVLMFKSLRTRLATTQGGPTLSLSANTPSISLYPYTPASDTTTSQSAYTLISLTSSSTQTPVAASATNNRSVAVGKRGMSPSTATGVNSAVANLSSSHTHLSNQDKDEDEKEKEEEEEPEHSQTPTGSHLPNHNNINTNNSNNSENNIQHNRHHTAEAMVPLGGLVVSSLTTTTTPTSALSSSDQHEHHPSFVAQSHQLISTGHELELSNNHKHVLGLGVPVQQSLSDIRITQPTSAGTPFTSYDQSNGSLHGLPRIEALPFKKEETNRHKRKISEEETVEAADKRGGIQQIQHNT